MNPSKNQGSTQVLRKGLPITSITSIYYNNYCTVLCSYCRIFDSEIPVYVNYRWEAVYSL
jgi:hypothetical protein